MVQQRFLCFGSGPQNQFEKVSSHDEKLVTTINTELAQFCCQALKCCCFISSVSFRYVCYGSPKSNVPSVLRPLDVPIHGCLS